MYPIHSCQEIIEKSILELNLNNEPNELYEPIKYILSAGGKRIRPALVLMACNIFSDKIEHAIPAAIAIEMFHNFTLMHDDIMDNADMRRNLQTVHKKWNTNVAILSGDAMFIKAYEFIFKCEHPLRDEIIRLFNTTAIQVCEGQQYDMNFENCNQVSVNDYLKMIELKTAVLIACSLKTGAILGGASKINTDLLYTIGKNIGMAFQLQDDLLDVFANVDEFGKNIGGDIISNKKTFLLIKALELAKGTMLSELQKQISAKEFDAISKIKKITAIYNQLQIKEYTLDLINQYFTMVEDDLKKLDVTETRKNELNKVITTIKNRKK